MMCFEIRKEVVWTAHLCAVDTREGCDRLSLCMLTRILWNGRWANRHKHGSRNIAHVVVC